MMNCCGFTVVQWISESAQVIFLKCYCSWYIADAVMPVESVTERGPFYGLRLIEPRSSLVGPWRCLPSQLKHLEFLLYPLVSEGHNCITLSLGRKLKDHFWGPVTVASRWSNCVRCSLTLTPLVGHTLQRHGWTSGASSRGSRNVTRKSIHEQTTCVNRLCKWKI